jgi:hypothetical protein
LAAVSRGGSGGDAGIGVQEADVIDVHALLQRAMHARISSYAMQWNGCAVSLESPFNDIAARQLKWTLAFEDVTNALRFAFSAQYALLFETWDPELLHMFPPVVKGADGRVVFSGPRLAMVVHTLQETLLETSSPRPTGGNATDIDMRPLSAGVSPTNSASSVSPYPPKTSTMCVAPSALSSLLPRIGHSLPAVDLCARDMSCVSLNSVNVDMLGGVGAQTVDDRRLPQHAVLHTAPVPSHGGSMGALDGSFATRPHRETAAKPNMAEPQKLLTKPLSVDLEKICMSSSIDGELGANVSILGMRVQQPESDDGPGRMNLAMPQPTALTGPVPWPQVNSENDVSAPLPRCVPVLHAPSCHIR